MAQASLIKWLYFSGAHDETGAAVSSGSVYFYEPGSTSTQTTVYADYAGTIPIAQPVPLDAAGRAEVFITQNCETKVLDSTGATKRLTVNAESVDSPLVTCVYASQSTTLDVALVAIEGELAAVAPTVPVDPVATTTISTASPSFAFDATKPLNVFKATYAGAMGTLTVTWSAPATTIYSRYRIVIQTGASSTAAAVTFPASMKGNFPTTLIAASYYAADFEAVSTSMLAQVTAWIQVGGQWW